MNRLPLCLALIALPEAALAHGLPDGGHFLAGALHPLSGADHLLAMLAVGLLAAQSGRVALWALPAAFVAAALAGGALAAAGIGFPAVEPMILASLLLLGVAVALAWPLPLWLLLPVLALFGAAHGWAHAAEGPESGLAVYALGLAGVTAALHGLGVGLGRLIPVLALRALGAGTAVAGLALAVGG